MQAWIAESHGNDYAFALAIVAAVVAVCVAGLSWFGVEHRGVHFGDQAAHAAE